VPDVIATSAAAAVSTRTIGDALSLALRHHIAIVPTTPRPVSNMAAAVVTGSEAISMAGPGGSGAAASGVRDTGPAGTAAAIWPLPEAGSAPDDLLVNLTREDLNPAIAALQGLGGRHLMFVAFDLGRARRKAGLTIEEVVAIQNGPIVRLRVELPAGDPTYPSITPLVPAAQWDEREAHDLHGVVPVGHPDPRPLVIHEPAAAATPPVAGAPAAPTPGAPAAPPATSATPYKSFVAHGEGVYQLPVGPIHAGIIEPGHFRFSAVGESVLYLDARLFYTHRGLERLVEGKTLAEALPIVERACGVCTVTHATVYSRAVERVTGTVPPPRAQKTRVLLAEMERLYNHVGDLGNICAGAGFNFGVSRLGWQKERLLRLNERLTGHRYLMGVVAPGGLRLGLDERGLATLASDVTEIEREVRSIVRLLVRSEGFMSRLQATGVLTAKEARRLGAVGVAARASGLDQDLRRDRPAEGYRGIPISVIGASAGDAAARFHVRAQEIRVSAALIADLAGRLPGGPIAVPRAGEPRSGDVALAGAEGPRGASWLWLMAGADGRVARLHLRSASFANWPIVATVVPGNIVPDFPLINKSFELCYACTDR
jgi:Ni,Fe-hydrogenase III large subunit/Ni,Fe-hydrogenase III component G